MIVYQTQDLTIRKLVQEDETLLIHWLTNPEVLQFYAGRDRPHDLQLVRELFYQEDDEIRCIVEYKQQPIGYIQYYLVDDETLKDYGYAEQENIYGTDQFIGEVTYWNQGIGKKLINTMKEFLMNEKNASRIIMDPQVWNVRAITCYERCGFKKAKLLKEHEKHEGTYRDCWLMEYKE